MVRPKQFGGKIFAAPNIMQVIPPLVADVPFDPRVCGVIAE